MDWKIMKYIKADGTVEIWSNYEVSSDGIIRNSITKEIKSISDNGKGYKSISAWNGSKKGCLRYVHRIVASTFIETSVYETVDHIDRNKNNNNVSNLRWCTYRENNLNVSDERKKQMSEMGRNAISKARLIADELNKIKLEVEYDGNVYNFDSIQEAGKHFQIEDTRISRKGKGLDEWTLKFRKYDKPFTFRKKK